jgi:hypothetical protein
MKAKKAARRLSRRELERLEDERDLALARKAKRKRTEHSMGAD